MNLDDAMDKTDKVEYITSPKCDGNKRVPHKHAFMDVEYKDRSKRSVCMYCYRIKR